MGSKAAEAALAERAATQWGMFTAAQATGLGLTRKRLTQLSASGRVSHAGARGVYRFAGTPADALGDPARAHWLALNPRLFAAERIERLRSGGPDAVASHLTAAVHVHRLDLRTPKRLSYSVTAPRRTSNPRLQFHVSTTIDWNAVDGLPATTIPATVADLHRARLPAEQLGAIIGAALQRASADLATIARALDPGTDGGGREAALDMLAAAGVPETLAAGNELLFTAQR